MKIAHTDAQWKGLLALSAVLILLSSLGSSLANEIPPLRIVRALGDEGPAIGEYSSRTLTVALEVDRDAARIAAYTLKPRRFRRPLAIDAPRAYPGVDAVQFEVVLLGPNGATYTQRVDIGPLCFAHGGGAEPHVQGDTIRLHRESFLVQVPEITGFDRIELAWYERDRDQATRRVLGEHLLDRARYSPAGGAVVYEDLAIAGPGGGGESPTGQPVIPVLWPEDFGDTDIYRIYGDPAEGQRRINVVIVPDGYTYAEKSLMESHADGIVSHFRNRTPYKEHDPFINYTLVYAYSLESGTDECDCSVIKKTAMGTRFPEAVSTCGHSSNRCLFYGTGCHVNGTANIVATELRAPELDKTLVMVNTSRYGGCGGFRAVYSAANSSAAEIAVHELGHSLAGLADEYQGNPGCGSTGGEVNTSTDAVNGAWDEWVADLGPPVEGARYYDQCIYRPQANCEMRSLNQPFCPVCNQHWSLVTFAHPRVSPTAPIQSMAPASPISGYVGVPVDFSAVTRLSAGPSVTNEFTWSLTGPGYPVETIVSTDGTSYTHTFGAEGQFTLSLEVVADTNFVKPERYGANRESVSWTVDVVLLSPPGEVSPPGATDPFGFTDEHTLVWEDGSDAGAWSYGIYRGDLSALDAGNYGACLESGVTQTTLETSGEPASGQGWFFLVTGANPVGEGPLGFASSGTARIGSLPCN